MFGNYVLSHDGSGGTSWPGFAIFLHTFLIFIASLVYKVGL